MNIYRHFYFITYNFTRINKILSITVDRMNP